MFSLTSYDGLGVKYLTPIKNASSSNPSLCPAPSPLQINIDRCISKFASHLVHQEMGIGIVYATQDPKFGCCF